MKVLVIGDSCQDVFRYGNCQRLSPEAPVPIFLPTRTTGNGGMTINVMENMIAMGIECDIITNDIRPVKTRYVDEVSNQMLLRVDEKDIIDSIDLNILHNIDFGRYDAIIISDYNKGFLDEDDIEYILYHHDLVFIDTKKEIEEWILKAEYIKINEKEFLPNERFLRGFYEGNLIVTYGNKGAVLNYKKHFSIEKGHEVRDLSGAGDTFLAALVVEYLKNNNIEEAIRFANKCASWVVTQKGVVAVDPTQI